MTDDKKPQEQRPEHVSPEKIAPMIEELADFLMRNSTQFDAVEVSCALANALLVVFKRCSPEAQQILASNFAQMCDVFAAMLAARPKLVVN
jgi:hypothetical protein